MDRIADFLSKNPCRLSFGDKWMVAGNEGGDIIYTVYVRPYRARKSKVLYRGAYLETALLTLAECFRP